MEIASREHKNLLLPLPIYQTVLLADATSRDGEKFYVYAGLTKDLVGILRTCSLDDADSALQNNTSDRKRFGEGSYEEWYGKNRTIFSLVHAETNALAAVAWFGPKALGQKSMKHLSGNEPEKEKEIGDWHTVSYRSYGQFRGKGLMKDFVRFTMEEYCKAFPGAKLWAIIDARNAASAALAAKLGFIPAEGESGSDSLVMVKK